MPPKQHINLLVRANAPTGRLPTPQQGQSGFIPMVKRNSRPFQIAVGRVDKSTSVGDVNSAKNQQAYMYPGGKIVRAPSVLINGRYYTDPKGSHHTTDAELAIQSAHQGELGYPAGIPSGEPRRSHESNFLITINPNRKWGPAKGNGEDPIIAAIFHKALMALTTNENFLSLLKIPSKTKTPHYTAHYQRDGQAWTDANGVTKHLPFVDVLNGAVKWDATVEVGEKQHRMHAHCVVELRHYSQLQFNIDMIQTIFRREFNLEMGAAGVSDRELRGKPYVDVQLLKQNNIKDIMYRYVRKTIGGKTVTITINPL